MQSFKCSREFSEATRHGNDVRWEPLKPELVVEVSFDHVTANRFRHGTKILRWRPDKSPAQCTMEQIALKA